MVGEEQLYRIHGFLFYNVSSLSLRLPPTIIKTNYKSINIYISKGRPLQEQHGGRTPELTKHFSQNTKRLHRDLFTHGHCEVTHSWLQALHYDVVNKQ